MKNKYNTLSKYIFDHSEKEYRKETIEGLFRSILEPVVSNQKFESFVLLKLEDVSKYSSVIKRLNFSGAQIIGFSDNLEKNYTKENIWDQTEFVIVIGQRYSACLVWDYSYSKEKDKTNICLLYNSKIISDIAKTVLDNSAFDFKDLLSKYVPDRRENLNLNKSINSIVSLLDEKNEDIIFSELDKSQIFSNDDTYQTAEIVSNKARFIAHEIKNNLSIINLYSKILEKRLSNFSIDSGNSESVTNSIKNISSASENVSYLISDLRCLSTPFYSEINIKQFIYSSVMMSQEKANKSGVEIFVSDFDDYIVKTDKIKLQCAITNILFNAIEACKNGSTININVQNNGKDTDIIIENNGLMIPVDIQNKIFEPDFTTKETGNGLGLAICKTQLRQLGGDINLEYSNENETAFKITIIN